MGIYDEVAIKMSRLRLPDATKLLSRAFWGDPFVKYLFPDEMERTTMTQKFFWLDIWHKLTTCEVSTTSSFRGIAIWCLYGEKSAEVEENAANPTKRMPYIIGESPYLRLAEASRTLEKERKRIMYMPHCYLYLLGVEPGQWGKGYGGLLIKPILERADEKGRPCYLISMRESNLSFFDTYGFKIIQAKPLSKQGPFIWFMVREPVIRGYFLPMPSHAIE